MLNLLSKYKSIRDIVFTLNFFLFNRYIDDEFPELYISIPKVEILFDLFEMI